MLAESRRITRDKVRDHIKRRCPDIALRAADVASSLNVSRRTVHRALAACGETFGAMLIEARVDLAVCMLRSPLFDRVTTAEIGRRAGFSDASHFTRVLRRKTGKTPLQMRRASRLEPRDERRAGCGRRPQPASPQNFQPTATVGSTVPRESSTVSTSASR